MQLVSCTSCRRTWEYSEEKPEKETSSTGETIYKLNGARAFPSRMHNMPCWHHYAIEQITPLDRHGSVTSMPEVVSIFTEVLYIPTFQTTIDIELAAALLQKDIGTSSDLISFYHDVIDASESFLKDEPTLDGEGRYLLETIHYKGQEVEHCSYFEPETFQLFNAAELGVLSYIHRKQPTFIYEQLAQWGKEHSPLNIFDEVPDTID